MTASQQPDAEHAPLTSPAAAGSGTGHDKAADMDALTIRQPWAHAILHAGKNVENRSWKPSRRAPFRLAIHAGKGYDQGAYPDAPGRDALDFGAVVGEVDVVGWHHANQCGCQCSPWAMPDQWHWWLGDRITYAEALPAVGRLGLWRWPR